MQTFLWAVLIIQGFGAAINFLALVLADAPITTRKTRADFALQFIACALWAGTAAVLLSR